MNFLIKQISCIVFFFLGVFVYMDSLAIEEKNRYSLTSYNNERWMSAICRLFLYRNMIITRVLSYVEHEVLTDKTFESASKTSRNTQQHHRAQF
jgi:hypothetical protein